MEMTNVPNDLLVPKEEPAVSKSMQKRISVQRTGKLPETISDPKKKPVAMKKAPVKKPAKKAVKKAVKKSAKKVTKKK